MMILKKTNLLAVCTLLTLFIIRPAYCNNLITAQEGFIEIVGKLTPAVVNISSKQKGSFRNSKENFKGRRGGPSFPDGFPFQDPEEFLKRFGLPFGMDRNNPFELRKAISLGSGFIIDPQGYIVTNNHVVAEAEEIRVKLTNGQELKATIIGTDPKTDLALIKVDTKKPLSYVSFGESEKVKVGEWAIAIGNPFGLGGTVTVGIVSAHARDIYLGGIVDEFIQTDAAINRGNSGGPLFNIKGEVIGINTAIAATSFTGGNVGIGFAIPSAIARPVIEQLKQGIKPQRGFIGVRIQDLTEEISESLGLAEQKGALVTEVTKNSPADKAGIKLGDIIIEFDGKPIINSRRLSRVVAETPIQKKVPALLITKNGAKKTTNVIIDGLIDELADGYGDQPNNVGEWDKYSDHKYKKEHLLDIQGVRLAKLTAELCERCNIDKKIQGVLVLQVKRGSEWAELGIQSCDVIVEANQESITTPSQLETIIKKQQGKSKKFLSLLINREGQNIFLALQIYKE